MVKNLPMIENLVDCVTTFVVFDQSHSAPQIHVDLGTRLPDLVFSSARGISSSIVVEDDNKDDHAHFQIWVGRRSVALLFY